MPRKNEPKKTTKKAPRKALLSLYAGRVNITKDLGINVRVSQRVPMATAVGTFIANAVVEAISNKRQRNDEEEK